MVSKLNMAAWDEVDVVLNQSISNAHSESSNAKPAKAKWIKKARNGKTIVNTRVNRGSKKGVAITRVMIEADVI